jgi:hypothetical protein
MPTAREPLAQDALLVQFARRAVVRASLYDVRELSLAAAIAPLKAEACNTGLTFKYRRETIDHIIGDAFSRLPHTRKFAALKGLNRKSLDYADHCAPDLAQEQLVEVKVEPDPLSGALHFLKHKDHAALHRLRARLSASQCRLLDAQLAELKRTRPNRGPWYRR